MELAPTGRLIAWLGISLLVVGSLLSNTIVLLCAGLLFFYLLFEGIAFHRGLEDARGSINLESHPSSIETTVGRPVRIELAIANHSQSKFHIRALGHNIPTQIAEEDPLTLRLTLGSNEVQHIETLLRTRIPGNIESTTSTILLERRPSLFTHSLQLPDKVVIIARPLIDRSVEQIDFSALTDIAVDHVRRGSGTDLAGIRPFNFKDDLQSIDWKATARAGRLMTKEFYVDKNPAVILMIDVSSSMKATKNEAPLLNILLSELEKSLGSIPPETSVGLILFDEQKIDVEIEPTSGVENRQRIIHALLKQATPSATPGPHIQQVDQRYRDHLMAADLLMKEQELPANTDSRMSQSASFTSKILPFLSKAKRNHVERLTAQGVFKAFERVCSLPEPVLVVVISSGATGLDGLCQGARNAAISNHRVIITILSQCKGAAPIEKLSGLKRFSVRVSERTPKEISGILSVEIPAMSHARSVKQ